MGLRKSINDRPGMTIGVIGLLAIAAVAYFVYQSRPGPGTSDSAQPAYYSSDDGQSWFIDRPPEPPPYMKDGKEVVRAQVFQDKVTGEEYIGYLAKFTPESKLMLIDNARLGGRVIPPPQLIKRPGESEWISTDDPNQQALVAEIMRPRKSPAGNPVLIVNPG